MSRFFPTASYAEDQSYAHTLLISHVIHRGAQVGAGFGAITGAVRTILARRRGASPQIIGLIARTTGYGTLIGAATLGVMGVTGRMWGREEIEWKDRSWRLVQNKGQVECDDWSVGGTVAGAIAAAVREGQRGSQWRALRLVGGAGLGNLAGVAGYMCGGMGFTEGDGKNDDLDGLTALYEYESDFAL